MEKINESPMRAYIPGGMRERLQVVYAPVPKKKKTEMGPLIRTNVFGRPNARKVRGKPIRLSNSDRRRAQRALYNPEPELQHLEPELEPELQHLEPELQHPEPELQYPEPEQQYPEPELQHLEPELEPELHHPEPVPEPMPGPSRARSPVVMQETLPDDLSFTITRGTSRTFLKSAATDTSFNVNLGKKWEGLQLGEVLNKLHDVFTQVLRRVGGGEGDRIRVVFRHPSLENPIVVSARQNMTADHILEVVEKTLTSYKDLDIRRDFQIVVGVIRLPGGGGKKYVTNLSRDIPSKNSIIQIKNQDAMCAARAVAVAYTKSCLVDDLVFKEATKDFIGTHVEKVLATGKASASFYGHLRKGDKGKLRYQYNMGKILCEKADISTERPCSLGDLAKFEDVLDRNICVIQAELGNKFVRRATHRDRTNLYLYMHDEHYDAIVSMTGFFNQSYFCNDCLKPYQNRHTHICESHCPTCTSTQCIAAEGDMLECPDCNQLCRSQACLLRHKITPYQKTLNMCSAFYRCSTCKKVMPSSRRVKHKCGEWECKSCQTWVVGDHLCYIRAVDKKETQPNFVFYDFETTQETSFQCEEGYVPTSPLGCEMCQSHNLCDVCSMCCHCKDLACGSYRHVPNLVVARTVCADCVDTESDTCETCGDRCPSCIKQACPLCPMSREIVFRDSNRFCAWLVSEQHKNFTCVAHNAKAFDGYFILDYLSKQGIQPTDVIFNGTKIMYFTVRGLRFVDSYNFLAMPLAKLPKAFGLSELKKGHFPHYFNKLQNRDYVGPLPDPIHYGVDDMTPEARHAFLTWHENRRTEGPFDFDRELVDYCKSDVDILTRACLSYRSLMLEATDVDPFSCVTVAGAAMKVFKCNFLKENWAVQLEGGSWHDAIYQGGKWKVKVDDGDYVQGLVVKNKKFLSTPIAQVPSQGYVTRTTYSKSSIQWLEWLRHTQGVDIAHALNGSGEQKVGGYYVDGLCGTTVYEFHGCFWHGCPTCYPLDRSKILHPRTQQSMSELFALTLHKQQVLESLGYLVVTKWEHEFHADLKSDSELRRYVNSLDLVERLNPRDSFFGGRTNALKLHHLTEEDEEVRYVDFTSLYPYVNKYKEYPVGHPKILTGDFEPLDRYFGLAKVKVLPPRSLYLPVLPYRSQGKLKFPLCSTCADSESQTTCKCSDSDRALVGTWCIPEILKALEKGYALVKIYEIYHFDQTTGEGGLFSEYVDTFLKYKQESSDWPEWCHTPDDRDRYLADYLKHEGVTLDETKVSKNPGLRSLSKIKLNSLWGKFGQRHDFTKSQYFTKNQLEDFYSLVSDTCKIIKNFHIVNKNLILMEYCDEGNQTQDDNMTNVFIATFTTCWARLHLYEVMEPLGDRVLYHDTDSVIYVHKPDLVNPRLGDYLGQLTDELQGDSIVEFVSAGPKNYAYRTKSGKEVCKVRGFRLNFRNSTLINFGAVRDIVTCNQTKRIRTLDKKILRHKPTNTLYNRDQTKTYKLVYDKRALRGVCTLPYGY